MYIINRHLHDLVMVVEGLFFFYTLSITMVTTTGLTTEEKMLVANVTRQMTLSVLQHANLSMDEKSWEENNSIGSDHVPDIAGGRHNGSRRILSNNFFETMSSSSSGFFPGDDRRRHHIAEFERGRAKFFKEIEMHKDKDIFLSTNEIISKYGYPLQVHRVVSRDGYITTFQRIPYGKNGVQSKKATKGPILLFHGIFQSSIAWFAVSADRSLPFLLADQGYDVFIGNFRGTSDSKLHKRLNPDDLVFWQFGMHEGAVHDLPLTIDSILRIHYGQTAAKSGERRLDYVGYSLGATIFFMMMSTYPEYNSKVRRMVAMAPAVFVGRTRSPFKAFSYLTVDDLIIKVFDLVNKGLLIPLIHPLDKIVTHMCRLRVSEPLCRSALILFTLYNQKQYNATTMSRLYASKPTGTTVRMFVHLLQATRTGAFRHFDYGLEKNRKIYGGRTIPPDYDLRKVRVPVYGLCAMSDELTTFEDCRQTLMSVKNLTNSQHIKILDPTYQHIDFIVANNVKSLVYDRLVHFLGC